MSELWWFDDYFVFDWPSTIALAVAIVLVLPLTAFVLWKRALPIIVQFAKKHAFSIGLALVVGGIGTIWYALSHEFRGGLDEDYEPVFIAGIILAAAGAFVLGACFRPRSK